MRSCTICRPCWRPGPACASSAAPESTPTPERRPNEVLLGGEAEGARARNRNPGAQADHCADPLAQSLVGQADGGHVEDGGVLGEHVLHLLGGDVLPAADDDVLLAVGDREVAVAIQPADVAGAEPAPGQEGVAV